MDEDLRLLLRDAEGSSFRFTFAVGEQMLARLMDASHVDEDDTLIVLRVGAAEEECGWQIHLGDIRAVHTEDGIERFRWKGN
jgi:hypothetical protein